MIAAFKTNKINDPKGVSSQSTVLPILVAISISHLINDSLQSLIPASYPIIKESFQLNFAQIGLVTFVNQITASLLQPLVGAFTDRHHLPFSLAIGCVSRWWGWLAWHLLRALECSCFRYRSSASAHQCSILNHPVLPHGRWQASRVRTVVLSGRGKRWIVPRASSCRADHC